MVLGRNSDEMPKICRQMILCVAKLLGVNMTKATPTKKPGNYRKEYNDFHGKPEQIKLRVERCPHGRNIKRCRCYWEEFENALLLVHCVEESNVSSQRADAV